MTTGGPVQNVSNEFIRALAAANGIVIPDERLELVREQYESYLRTLAELAALPLERETEPAFMPVAAPAASTIRR